MKRVYEMFDENVDGDGVGGFGGSPAEHDWPDEYLDYLRFKEERRRHWMKDTG